MEPFNDIVAAYEKRNGYRISDEQLGNAGERPGSQLITTNVKFYRHLSLCPPRIFGKRRCGAAEKFGN